MGASLRSSLQPASKREIEEAVRYYSSLVRREPANASAYNNLGTAYKSLGKYREAEAAYRAALRVDPTYLRGYFRLACLFALQKRDDEARAELLCYFQAGGSQADAQSMLTGLDEAATIMRLLPQVLEQARASASLAPSRAAFEAEAMFNRGLLELESDPLTAADCFQAAVELDPMHAMANKELGRLLKERGRQQNAVTHLERAVQLLPNDPEAWILYAQACGGLALIDRALSAYEYALALAPESFDACFGAGVCLITKIEAGLDTHRAQEAEDYLNAAARIRPESPAPQNQISRLRTASSRITRNPDVRGSRPVAAPTISPAPPGKKGVLGWLKRRR